MSITIYSLNQWSSIKNHHSVKEQARQEEVQTGTEQPGQLQRERGGQMLKNKIKTEKWSWLDESSWIYLQVHSGSVVNTFFKKNQKW